MVERNICHIAQDQLCYHLSKVVQYFQSAKYFLETVKKKIYVFFIMVLFSTCYKTKSITQGKNMTEQQ